MLLNKFLINETQMDKALKNYSKSRISNEFHNMLTGLYERYKDAKEKKKKDLLFAKLRGICILARTSTMIDEFVDAHLLDYNATLTVPPTIKEDEVRFKEALNRFSSKIFDCGQKEQVNQVINNMVNHFRNELVSASNNYASLTMSINDDIEVPVVSSLDAYDFFLWEGSLTQKKKGSQANKKAKKEGGMTPFENILGFALFVGFLVILVYNFSSN